jgi:hypothetical protein
MIRVELDQKLQGIQDLEYSKWLDLQVGYIRVKQTRLTAL